MYSEIKSENKILINRLSSDERILLENIYNKSLVENSKFSMEKLLDDSADFGGVIISLTEGSTPKIELNEASVKELWLPIGESENIVFDTNVSDNDVIILTHIEDNSNFVVTTSKNVITISPTETQELSESTIYYCIEKEGYESYHGTIIVHIVERPQAKVYIKVTTKEDIETYIEGATYIVKNEDETLISSLDDGSYNLDVGNYNIEITHPDYINASTTFEVTNEDLLVASVDKILSVMEKKV